MGPVQVCAHAARDVSVAAETMRATIGYAARMSSAAPTSRHRLAEIGALLAEPARAGILLALIDGSARPAGELAALAGIAPATASAHLQRLVAGGLLSLHAQGRHRYFRLAGEDVAHLVETLALAGSPVPTAAATSPAETPLRRARTCYHHLAGRLGVALFERLRGHDALELGSDAIRLNAAGARWLHAAGLFDDDAEGLALAGRSCVDWTERRFHLAGALGNRLAERLFERGWLRPRRDSRALALGANGDAGLRALGIDWTRL